MVAALPRCVLCGEKILIDRVRKGADGAGLVDHPVHLGGEPAFVQKVIIDLADHPGMNRPGATADGIFEAGLAEWNGRVEFLRELSSGLEGLMDALHAFEAFEVGKTAALINNGVVVEKGFQGDALEVQGLGKVFQPRDDFPGQPQPFAGLSGGQAGAQSALLFGEVAGRPPPESVPALVIDVDVEPLTIRVIDH